MSLRILAYIFGMISFVAPIMAEEPSISAEELERLVDQRVAELNPYQALLNDPVPMRSRAAMEIMLESGDATLVRMASEYGLLSTDPSVRLSAVDYLMRQGPVLTVRLDGSVTESSWFASRVQNFDGSLTEERAGVFRVQVGSFDDTQKCFVWVGATKACAFSITSDAILFHSRHINGSFLITAEGSLLGTVAMHSVPETIPASIQLLE